MVVRRFYWLTIPLLGILVFAACGGGSSSVGPDYTGGPVVCDALEANSYTYTIDTGIDVDNPEIFPAPTNVSRGPPTVHFTSHVEAEVENGDRFNATVTNSDGGSSTTFGSIEVDGEVYTKFGSEWEERGSVSFIPYGIVGVCNALAPDLELESMTGTTDEAIASEKFEIDSLSMLFASRIADLAGGDVAALVQTYDITVWVAQEGSYIRKVELSGTGFYGDETSVTFTLSYEISDMGGDISVDPPI